MTNKPSSHHHRCNTVGIDSSVSILGHELAEIITDPLLSSWNDAYGQEVAGKAVPYASV